MGCSDNVPSDVSWVELNDLTRIIHSEIPGQPSCRTEEFFAGFVLIDNIIPGGVSPAAHKARSSSSDMRIWIDLSKAFPKQGF